MRSLLRAALLSALFSAVAVLLHSWAKPYGLFLALAVIVVLMRYLATWPRNRLPLLLAASIWFFVAWIASTERNSNEILIQGDSIGSAFIVGASALMALLVLTAKRN